MYMRLHHLCDEQNKLFPVDNTTEIEIEIEFNITLISCPLYFPGCNNENEPTAEDPLIKETEEDGETGSFYSYIPVL